MSPDLRKEMAEREHGTYTIKYYLVLFIFSLKSSKLLSLMCRKKLLKRNMDKGKVSRQIHINSNVIFQRLHKTAMNLFRNVACRSYRESGNMVGGAKEAKSDTKRQKSYLCCGRELY